MSELVAKVGNELLKFAVVLRGDVVEHQAGKLQLFLIALEVLPPADIVDVFQGNPVFLGAHKGIVVGVFNVEIVIINLFHIDISFMAVNRIDGVGNELQQTSQCEPERIDGAFETLQH